LEQPLAAAVTRYTTLIEPVVLFFNWWDRIAPAPDKTEFASTAARVQVKTAPAVDEIIV
jgi:hypothetical protein